MSRPALPWIKLYTKITRDPDFLAMENDQRGIYVMLLCHAAEQTPRGSFRIINARSMAYLVANGDENALMSVLDYCLNTWKTSSGEGHVYEEGGRYYFRTFSQHQRPASEEPKAIAERKSRSKESRTEIERENNGITRALEIDRDIEGNTDREEDLSAPYSPPPSTTEDREAEAVAQVPVAMQIAKALHLDTYTGERHRKVAQALFLARSRLPQLLTLARRERAEYSFASATFDQKMGVLERLVRRVTETAPTQPPPKIAPVIPFPERKEEFPSTGEAAWAEVVEFCQDSARKGLGRDGRGTDFLRIAALQFLSADNEAKIIRLAGYLQGTRPFDTMVINAINSTRGAFGWKPEIEWHQQAAEVTG